MYTTLTANQAGAVRYDTLNGRQHLVVPMVMLTEGVHAGSGGAYYYPGDEIAKTPALWDHKPIVVYHPTNRDGTPADAADPVVLNTRGIGLVLNTRWDGKKLRADAWLDTEKTKAVDGRVLEAVTNNRLMELSTGLYVDNDAQPGKWNDEEYLGRAINHKPNHLAVLPDQVGACSIKDGAGLLQTNASGMSYNELMNSLQTILSSTYGEKGRYWDGWIADVYPDEVVYYGDDRKLYAVGYTVNGTSVKLAGDPKPVERVIEYRGTGGKSVRNSTDGSDAPNPKETEMAGKTFDKQAHLNSLLNNGYSEAEVAALSKLDDAPLQLIKPIPKTPPVTNTAPTPTPTPEPTPTPTPTPAPKPPTFAELLANADPATKEMMGEMNAMWLAERNRMIGVITANAANQFTPDQLNGMSVPMLRNLEALARPQGAPTGPTLAPTVFYGNPAPITSNTTTADEAPLLPVPLFPAK